jgi:hypothetical protein
VATLWKPGISVAVGLYFSRLKKAGQLHLRIYFIIFWADIRGLAPRHKTVLLFF